MVRRWSVVTVALATACIIPDSDIEVRPARTNPGAVRIVEAVALTEAAHEACTDVVIADQPPFQSCPLPPINLPTGLIRAPAQTFCVCPEGQVDADALRGFEIFVEDPDVDVEGAPRDDLFGVFLLDVPQDATDLGPSIAYTNYLDPTESAKLYPLGDVSYKRPIERPTTNLKSWSLGVDERVDLCNNNNGQPVSDDRTLHSLELIVTDRPWYVPVALDDEGAPMRDENGELVRSGDPLPGVPDLPEGATFSVAHYVFECLIAEDVMGEAGLCDCVAPEEES